MYYEVYEAGTLLLSGTSAAALRDCNVSYVSDIVFTAPMTSDRTMLHIKTVLTDRAGSVLAYNTLPIEVFEPVTAEEHDNVVLCGPYEPGQYELAGETVTLKACGMLPLHFASRPMGHPIVRDFREKDISYWYDAKQDMITPLLNATFTAEGFTLVVTSSNKDANGAWKPALAVGIKEYKGKYYVLSQLDLRTENPAAKRLLKAIYDYTRS